MKNMRLGSILAITAAAIALLAVKPAQAVTYYYVGSWNLATLDGAYGNPSNPYLWTNNPLSYSGVTGAAQLFGGNPANYVTSTVDDNPANINFLAFVDGWGDDQYLFNPQPDTFDLQTGTGYADPGGGGTAYSALVVDHAPFDDGTFVNYAFSDVPPGATPEPSPLATVLIGCGVLAAFYFARRRSIKAQR